ncbi:hypothetical protein HB662_22990 [Roseomonas frigidaquae]|uniref:Uncharacterized protein n=1 Tax=Falsiroseomonas frigidaquae TaxID=487318 RepID=A0ABX1F5L6_9PROT|nr:hypothetical protein [Falsiroseomonas frigidaquae]NKE47664.1 hypothetical protein [Falsiroseomonas frigidaquae]
MTKRRTLLTCLPIALAPGAAGAFRLEAPSAETAADYGSGCPDAHAALRAEVERMLEGRKLPPALEPRIASLARCPFCGCAVAGAADHGEDRPPTGG